MQVQGTINGYGERTGNCNLTTIIPNLTLKMGVRTLPEGRLERLTSSAHHIAEIVNITPEPAAALRRLVGVRAQGRAPRVGDRPPQGRLRARRPRRGRQRHPVRRVGDGRQGHASSSRPRSSGSTLDGPALTGVIDELKRLEHEGFHFEAADGSLELLMRRATGWEQDFFERRVVPGHRRTRPRASRAEHRGDRQGLGRRRAACIDDPRGQRPGQRARRRAAAGDRRALPAAGQDPPHRLQGPGPRHRRRAPARSRGSSSTRRTATQSWSTIGVGENVIVGVVAGPRGLPRLRAAAHRRVALAGRGCARLRPRQADRPAACVRVAAAAAREWMADAAGRGRRRRQSERDEGRMGSPGSGPGLHLDAHSAGSPAKSTSPTASTSRTRMAGAVAVGAQAGVVLRAGAGRPRPHASRSRSGASSTTTRPRSWSSCAARCSRTSPTRTTTPSCGPWSTPSPRPACADARPGGRSPPRRLARPARRLTIAGAHRVPAGRSTWSR